MPEKDYFPGIARAWQPPCRVLSQDGAPEEVVREIVRAPTRELRRAGGLASLPALSHLLYQVAAGTVSEAQALHRLDSINREWHGDRHTPIAIRAVIKLLNESQPFGLARLRPDWALGLQFCRELVRHEFLDRALLHSVGKRFASPDQAERFAECCWDLLKKWLPKIASQLAADHTAARLRAPRGSVSQRVPTSQLLEESVDV